MSFKFISEENQAASRQTRFVTPLPNEDIHWWAFATPEPAYSLCVVRITKVIDAKTLECKFFDPTQGKEIDAPAVRFDVTDRNIAWRGLPSSLGALDPAQPILPKDCALLCFADSWLAINAPQLDTILNKPGVRIKFPFADDGMPQAIRRLASELKKLGVDPSGFVECAHLPASWMSSESA